jgi:tetratricopeptide (TPR) repeat protein
MALLPDGMSEADSRTILSDGEPSEEEIEAASVLETARLSSRADGRWRLLAPIRETLLADFPPEAEDRARLVNVFLRRTALGNHAGRDRWNDMRDEVTAEAGNLDAMIGVAAREPELSTDLARAMSGLGQLHRVTGLASCASLLTVAARFHDAGDLLAEANCLFGLGLIAGDRSDHDGARKRYEAALPLYRKVGDLSGEANCIFFLGQIALDRSDHEGARQRYEPALPLYQRAGAVLGEANCIRSLGDIALARSDYEVARQRYEAALPLYQRVGSVLGEANCIKCLGDVGLPRFEHAGARRCYEAALPLYRKVGHVQGEANCIQRLGDIDEAEGEIALACGRWREALALYARIPEPYSIGFAHIRLARHAARPAEAAEHRARPGSRSTART